MPTFSNFGDTSFTAAEWLRLRPRDRAGVEWAKNQIASFIREGWEDWMIIEWINDEGLQLHPWFRNWIMRHKWQPGDQPLRRPGYQPGYQPP